MHRPLAPRAFPRASLALILLVAPQAFSHGDSIARFVAPTGVDDGTCANVASPCRTIRYAIEQSTKGDRVLLAEGTYAFDAEEASLLMSDVIPVAGGYRTQDGFVTRDAARAPTYVVGLPPRHRQRLAERGITLIADRKGAVPAPDRHQARVNAIATAPATIFCVGGFVGSYPCENVNLLGIRPLSTFSTLPTAANDIWGFVDLNNGREYALIGLSNATAVIDIARPRRPREVGSIPGTTTVWRDIKVVQFFDQDEGRWKGYAYVVSDSTGDGLQIIDLTNLPFSVSLAATYTEFASAHNIYISNVDYATGRATPGRTPFAYILGSNRDGGAYRILDLSDPLNPVEVTAPPSGTQYVHDGSSVTLEGAEAERCGAGRTLCELFIDFNENTVDLWDTTDKAAPVLMSETPYEQSSYTHSGWWSEDGRYVYVQDEIDELGFGLNTTLRILDISDPFAPFLAGEWVGPTPAIDHNGFVHGERYYMSNYRRGLTILDISKPTEPTQIGFFDTFPDSDSATFSGAWGVYPFLPSGRLLVSDLETGLFILSEGS